MLPDLRDRPVSIIERSAELLRPTVDSGLSAIEIARLGAVSTVPLAPAR